MNKAINLSDLVKATRDSHRNNLPIDVPCGDCHECCKLPVHLTKFEQQRLGQMALAKKDDGYCEHLNNSGQCVIYSLRPEACKKFDCRPNFLLTAMGHKANVTPTTHHKVVIDDEVLLLKLIITAMETIDLMKKDRSLRIFVWLAACMSYEKAYDNLMDAISQIQDVGVSN